MKSTFMAMVHKVWFLDQISKLGDFKAASSLLGVTPSAITQAIKSLEGHFEKTLLIRNKGSINLTSEGQALLEKFGPILEDLEKIDQEYSAQGMPCKLRMGAYDSLAIRYLPKLYSNILNINPQIKIDLKVGRSAELITLINRGHLDMALVVDPHESDTYFTTHIAYNALSIFSHKKNLEDQSTIRKLGFGCLRSDVDGRQAFLIKALHLLNLKSKNLNVQTDSFEVLLALCLEGYISAILPVDLAGSEQTGIEMAIIYAKIRGVHRDVYLDFGQIYSAESYLYRF